MASTMLLGAASLIGVFFIHTGSFALVMLMSLGVLYSVANSCYWILSNAVYLSYAGKSDTPGKLTAYNFIATLLAATTVSLVAFFLHLDHNFLLLFILMGMFLLVSILPLRFLSPPVVEPVSFRECLKGISGLGFWANVNPEQTIVTLGIPLITLSLFGSLGTSINISVIVAIVTMVLIYGAGTSKDKNSNKILWPALIVACTSAIAYAFIKTQEAFIVVGIVYSTSYSIVDAVREARLSREVSNGINAVQTTVAIEFARSIASLIGGTVLMTGYLIFHTIWQPLLILGVVFIILRAFYALKNIAEIKNILMMQ